MNLDEYQRLTRERAALGAIAVTILGGEPLVFRQLDEVISILKKKKYLIYLVSSETLFNDDRLKKLKDAGLDYINLSLDSMDEATNDGIRGAGHFRKAMENIDLIQSSGILVGLGPVFFPDHLDDNISVVEYCKKRGIQASGGQVTASGSAATSSLLRKNEHDQVRALLKEHPQLTFDWAMSYYLEPRCPAGKEKIGI